VGTDKEAISAYLRHIRVFSEHSMCRGRDTHLINRRERARRPPLPSTSTEQQGQMARKLESVMPWQEPAAVRAHAH
jgi:hypothetical protein